MNFVNHPTNNHTFGVPPNWDHEKLPCGALPVTVTPQPDQGCAQITSYWKPSTDELIELNSGGLVTLNVMGAGHPIVSLGVAPRVEREVPRAPIADVPRRRAEDAR